MTCKHPTTRSVWRTVDGAEVEFARFCANCGAQMGLGPAKDSASKRKLDPDDVPITTDDNIGMTSRQVREQQAESDRVEGELRAQAMAARYASAVANAESFVDDQHRKQAAVFDAAAERYEKLKVDVIAQFAGVVDHASGVNGTLAGLIEAEISAATEYADAKELAVLEHGYGGKGPVEPGQIVGLEPYTPDLGGES